FGDGFILKLNPAGNALLASTFLGGSDTDEIYGLALDASDNIYVAGDTNSADFPLLNAFQGSLKGKPDAFVAKLNPTASFLIFSTYFGGAQQEWAYDITVDSSGNAYITGQTNSPDFPVLSAYQTAKNSGIDAFFAKFQPGGTLVFSSFLGGSGTDQGFGIR